MSETVLKPQDESVSAPIAPGTKKRQSPPPIELVYRQVFDWIDGKLFGFESQIRINNPKLGTLSPELFMPIAERSNQAVELGKWSFVEMSDMIRRQREKQHTINRMFMPVSMKYFCKKYFTDNAVRQLEKASMQPSDICLMLQAQDLLDAPVGLKEAFEIAHEKGFEIAVTGIGDGGLALSQLSDLPIDYLRFDAAFVQQLLTNDRAKEIANTLGELGTKLGAQLMADGVDSREYAEALQSIGCSFMQGAYFSDYVRESQMY